MQNEDYEISTTNAWMMSKIMLESNLEINPYIEDCELEKIYFILNANNKEIIKLHPECSNSEKDIHIMFNPLINYTKQQAEQIYNSSKIETGKIRNTARACIILSEFLQELLNADLFPQFRLELIELLNKTGSENLAVCTKKMSCCKVSNNTLKKV